MDHLLSREFLSRSVDRCFHKKQRMMVGRTTSQKSATLASARGQESFKKLIMVI